MTWSLAFLFIACLLFLFGSWSRWWVVSDPRGPYYPALISLGLFFLTLSMLWPQLGK